MAFNDRNFGVCGFPMRHCRLARRSDTADSYPYNSFARYFNRRIDHCGNTWCCNFDSFDHSDHFVSQEKEEIILKNIGCFSRERPNELSASLR